jgi:hypothetical protein
MQSPAIGNGHLHSPTLPVSAGERCRNPKPHNAPDAAARTCLPRDAKPLAVDGLGGVLLEAVRAIATKACGRERMRLDLGRRLHGDGSVCRSAGFEVRQPFPSSCELVCDAFLLPALAARRHLLFCHAGHRTQGVGPRSPTGALTRVASPRRPGERLVTS